jgi:hypothetical protein
VLVSCRAGPPIWPSIDFAECQKALGKLRIEKNKKEQHNIFFKLYEQLSNPNLFTLRSILPYPLPYYFEIKVICFVNGEIRTRNLSLVHTLLYHYTTTSIMSILYFHSPCTITNQE